MKLGWPLFFLAVCLWTAPARAAVYVGAGAGMAFTQGAAGQIAAPMYGNVEVHYSAWTDSETGRALGAGYRFANGGPLSVVLGVAYVPLITENLLHHDNAYIEVRWTFARHFSCQASHYSGVGRDRGENLLLCGVLWGRRAGR